MKIAIIGAGAMGCLFGGKLASVADVCFYDVNPKQVDAINEHGLIMTKDGEDIVVKARATTDPKEIGIVDAAIFFTKYLFLDSAATDALNCVGEDTVVLTLQNGLGTVDILKKYFPAKSICYGLTAYTSDIKGFGHIEMTTTDPATGTYFWPLTNKVTPQITALEETMREAGFAVEVTKEVDKKIWRKLMVNCAENTLCAILRVTVGQLVDFEPSYELLKQVVYEVSDVARAKGIDISRQEGLEYVDEVSAGVRGHFPSMGLDVKMHRKTEIACLNEAVAAEGKRYGVETPMLTTLARMIRTLEEHYEDATY